MKKNKDKFRDYKIIKIAKNDKFYWRPMFRDDTYLNKKEWHNLSIWIKDTDYIVPAEYKHKFSALRRIVEDKKFINFLENNKYEVFEEIEVGKIKINH